MIIHGLNYPEAESAIPNNQYRSALWQLLQNGEDIEVRGMQTRELLNFVTVIDKPWHRCHFVPGRRWNPWVAMSEALWILAGRDDLACLLPYNKRMADFSDNGENLWGAYGKRIKNQLEPMIRRLEADPHDRRAVLSIWRPDDLIIESKDPPCNDMIMFKLRGHFLHMTVINRSNDLHWGLYGVNLPTFSILQDWVAAMLGVGMGTQTHISNSLHIYTGGKGMKENYAITQRMAAEAFKPIPEMPDHERAFTGPVPHDTLVRACNEALDKDHVYEGSVPFIAFANDFLAAAEEDPVDLMMNVKACKYADQYADWVMAAQVWVEEGQSKF